MSYILGRMVGLGMVIRKDTTVTAPGTTVVEQPLYRKPRRNRLLPSPTANKEGVMEGGINIGDIKDAARQEGYSNGFKTGYQAALASRLVSEAEIVAAILPNLPKIVNYATVSIPAAAKRIHALQLTRPKLDREWLVQLLRDRIPTNYDGTNLTESFQICQKIADAILQAMEGSDGKPNYA